MTADASTARARAAGLWIFLACQAVAVALWLIPASVQIVQWPPAGPVRLALLPPLWQLAAASGMALLVSVFLLRRTITAAHTQPFLLLWLWVIPYLPWLPDRFPLLLVLGGPLRWVIAAMPFAMLAGRRSSWLRAMGGALEHVSRRTVFVSSLVLYLAAGLYAVHTVGLSGDEPHYLIITESLLKDGDLKIENNHQRGDYRAFSAATLRPDFWERGKNGEIYSVHAPGLAVLVLPVYALAGHWGAVALMCVLSALAALAIFDLALLAGGPRIAAITWIAVCLAVPLIPHAWSLFPETPATLLTAWAALWLLQPGERSWTIWLWRGLALSTLPWLHTKFSICLAILGLALAWRARRNLVAAAALLCPIGLSTAAWLYSFFLIYGSFDPQAPYGNYTNEYVLTRNIPHGLFGLFDDQKFGLLVYSPIYLLALGGLQAMWRRREWRFAGAVLLTLFAAFTLSTARLYMFWGGTSAPARFLVPMVPCLALFLAVALSSSRHRLMQAVTGVWLAIGLGIALWSILWPADRILYSDPHGHARLLEMIQGSAPLAAAVPTFTEPDWSANVATLSGWLFAGAVGLGVATLWSRRGDRSAWSVGLAACVGFLFAGAATARTPGEADRAEAARRGATNAIWDFDARVATAIDYRSARVATAETVRELTTMVVRPDRARVEAGGPVAGPLMLPAGRYEARVWFGDNRPRIGSLRASAIPPAPFGEATGSLSNPATVLFNLPVTIWRWTLIADRENARDVERVEIVPAAVRPPSEREGMLVRSVEPLDGGDARYLIYTDGNAFPEKGVFWTESTSRAQVLVAPASATRLVLTLYTGPQSGSVALDVGRQHRTVATVAGQEQDVVFSLPGDRLVPLAVRSSTAFRPADVDPSSTDVRRLGCQVRVRLE